MGKLNATQSCRQYAARGKQEISKEMIDVLEKDKSPINYDYKNTLQHERRLLLRAEPQIGKTQAYLQFLKVLQSRLSSITIDLPDIPDAPNRMISGTLNPHKWFYPYWLTLSNPLDFTPYKKLVRTGVSD